VFNLRGAFMKKRNIIIGSIIVIILISLLTIQFYKNKQEEKLRIEKERYNDLLLEEVNYFQNYTTTEKKNLNIKKIVAVANGYEENFVVLTESGNVYVRMSINNSYSKSDYLILESDRLGYQIIDIQAMSYESGFDGFILETANKKKFIAYISEDSNDFGTSKYSKKIQVEDNPIYTYVIDVERKFNITNIDKMSYNDYSGSGSFLTYDDEVYTYGQSYDGLLGLGFKKDPVEFYNTYTFTGSLVNPEKTIDNYGDIQGNVKQAFVKTPGKPHGKLSVLTNDGELYASGKYLSESTLDYHSYLAHKQYSYYLTYVEEIDEIQGNIDFIESSSFFDLIKTNDGKLYYFGIPIELVFQEVEEEVELVFYELKYDEKSIDAKEVRCSGSFSSNGCAILIDENLLTFGVNDSYENGEYSINVFMNSLSDELSIPVPSTLNKILSERVVINDSSEWIALHSLYDLGTMKTNKTYEDYLEERPDKFVGIDLDDLHSKLDELNLISE